MKKSILFLLAFITWQICFSQSNRSEYNNYSKRADSLFKQKEYKAATLAYTEAFKSLNWKGTKDDRYNAARAWALTDQPDSAFDCLTRIIKKRLLTNYDSVAYEKDFTSLHADKRWQPLLDQMKLHDAYKIPAGWFEPAAISYKYAIGIDKGTGKEGKNAATIKCKDWENGDSFGNLMQNISPSKFLGKRVRMSGYMKSKDVIKWASFWMRVDQDGSQKPLSFDNMLDGNGNKRAIKGTTDWKKYEIVLDVPEIATNIAFGIMLEGNGQIWVDDMSFEIVDKTVPTTGATPRGPENLGFEE